MFSFRAGDIASFLNQMLGPEETTRLDRRERLNEQTEFAQEGAELNDAQRKMMADLRGYSDGSKSMDLAGFAAGGGDWAKAVQSVQALDGAL